MLTRLCAEQVHQISFDKLEMAPATLAELVCAIDEGLVSGKIGKQVLPMLLQVRSVADEHQGQQQDLRLRTLQEYTVSVCGESV